MKKLLLLTLLPLGITAMQKNEAPLLHPPIKPLITIGAPDYDDFKRHYEIIAETSKEEVGIVTYKPTGNFYDKNAWLMKNLRVNAPYRKRGLAYQLFKACLEDIQRRGGTSVTWQAVPAESDLSEHELINIYTKMIAKVGPGLAHSQVNTDIEIGGYEINSITISITPQAKLV